MSTKSMTNDIKTDIAFDFQAIVNGSAAGVQGNIIDTQGYNEIDFSVIATAYTDGTFYPIIEESDDPLMSDINDITVGFSSGDYTGDPHYVSPDVNSIINPVILSKDILVAANTIARFGYKGGKRYVRLSILALSAPTGATIGAIISRKGEVLPVSV